MECTAIEALDLYKATVSYSLAAISFCNSLKASSFSVSCYFDLTLLSKMAVSRLPI